MRLFVAIGMPEALKPALEAVQAAIPLGRLTTPETLHLTLEFLGELDRPRAEAAHEALERVAVRPFTLQPAGLGTFGAPDVLWAGLREPAPVAALAVQVHAALHGAGLQLERRRFRPHITLARFAGVTPEEEQKLARFLAKWQDFPCPAAQISGFGLYQSLRTKSGAVHELLARYP